ncbi:unnamed protein product [Chrysoparadoxa australica]
MCICKQHSQAAVVVAACRDEKRQKEEGENVHGQVSPKAGWRRVYVQAEMTLGTYMLYADEAVLVHVFLMVGTCLLALILGLLGSASFSWALFDLKHVRESASRWSGSSMLKWYEF